MLRVLDTNILPTVISLSDTKTNKKEHRAEFTVNTSIWNDWQLWYVAETGTWLWEKSLRLDLLKAACRELEFGYTVLDLSVYFSPLSTDFNFLYSKIRWGKKSPTLSQNLHKTWGNAQTSHQSVHYKFKSK